MVLCPQLHVWEAREEVVLQELVRVAPARWRHLSSLTLLWRSEEAALLAAAALRPLLPGVQVSSLEAGAEDDGPCDSRWDWVDG